MKFIKITLMLMGSLFGICMVMFATVNSSQNNFNSLHQDFATNFIRDLSYSWDISDVKSDISQEFKEHINEANTENNLREFSILGEVTDTSTVILIDYIFMINKSTNVGIFSINTIFENGTAKVNIVVESDKGNVKVQTLHIEIVKMDHKTTPTRTQAII